MPKVIGTRRSLRSRLVYLAQRRVEDALNLESDASFQGQVDVRTIFEKRRKTILRPAHDTRVLTNDHVNFRRVLCSTIDRPDELALAKLRDLGGAIDEVAVAAKDHGKFGFAVVVFDKRRARGYVFPTAHREEIACFLG